MQLDELDLEFTRQKRVGTGTRAAYALTRVLDRLIGNKRVLARLLDLSRLMRRLAFEEAGRV
jgi:hypothetical protein